MKKNFLHLVSKGIINHITDSYYAYFINARSDFRCKSKMLYLFSFFVLISNNSCKTSQKDESIKDEYPIISVDYSEAIGEVGISKIVDTTSVQFIKLENKGGVIGNVNKLINTDNEYIIFDRPSQTIWIFETDGKYRTKIDKQGRGPNEYVSAHTITYKPQGEIGVLDVHNRLLWYDTYGNDLTYDNINYHACDIYYSDENVQHIMYRYIPADAEKSDKFFYHTTDMENDLKSKFFPYYEAGIFSNIYDNYFISNNNKFLIRMPYDNNFYKIEDGELKVAYSVDFGSSSFPHEKLQNAKNSSEFEEIISGKNYQGNIHKVRYSGIHLTFRYSHQSEANATSIAYVIYNFLDNKLINFNSTVVDDFGLYYEHPISSYKDYFYSIIYPYELWPSALSKLDLEGDPEFINPVIMKFQYQIQE